MTKFIQRLRDPIHGLIIFEDKIDEIAWKLINTPEFQRLRRIRQLGFSELVFPGATHTRFIHSIGVYHNARRLMKVVKKFKGNDFDGDRAKVILLAALLHDVGHGPFSHAFEEVRMEIAATNKSGPIEDHEKFTAKIIRNKSGGIYKALDDPELAENIAALFDLKQPEDIYHAVISSSFDADRLDFLVRDRYMTGTGTGAIDVDWLVDNLDECEVPIGQDDDDDEGNPETITTFVFKQKGRQAAEDFLLARYRLYTEVYLHKTTRGFEMILGWLLRSIANQDILLSDLNLSASNPLVRFFRNGENLDDYLELDDFVVWDVIRKMSKSTKNDQTASLAKRLLDRDHLHALDVTAMCGDDRLKLKNAKNKIQKHVEDDLGETIFKDTPTLSLYSTYNGEVEKVHKIIRVFNGEGQPLEITKFPDTIISKTLTETLQLIRYYFLTAAKKQTAEKAMKGR